jgi:hypothetical protein
LFAQYQLGFTWFGKPSFQSQNQKQLLVLIMNHMWCVYISTWTREQISQFWHTQCDNEPLCTWWEKTDVSRFKPCLGVGPRDCWHMHRQFGCPAAMPDKHWLKPIEQVSITSAITTVKQKTATEE